MKIYAAVVRIIHGSPEAPLEAPAILFTSQDSEEDKSRRMLVYKPANGRLTAIRVKIDSLDEFFRRKIPDYINHQVNEESEIDDTWVLFYLAESLLNAKDMLASLGVVGDGNKYSPFEIAIRHLLEKHSMPEMTPTIVTVIPK